MTKRTLSLLSVVLILASQAQAEPFRLIVLPDTQFNPEKWPQQLTTMTEWIAKNANPLNVKYVLHVGDMVNVSSDKRQWDNFDASMQVLDGKVPYVLAVGNHDFERSRASGAPCCSTSTFPPNASASCLHSPPKRPTRPTATAHFRPAGIKWLIVTMPFLPTDGQLEGANRVVKEHPDHRVIVLTHSYLTHTGRDKSGVYIWEKLVKRHRNISLVVCGHLSTVHFVSQATRATRSMKCCSTGRTTKSRSRTATWRSWSSIPRRQSCR